MSVMLECIGCREEKQFPVMEEYPVCLRCEEWEINHHEELEREMEEEYKSNKKNQKPKLNETICRLCGYEGPAIDHHHIHGRKISNETIIVCANCHREIHAGTRIQS